MNRDFTIGFSTSTSFVSRMLRWAMRSQISHVYGSWKIHEDVRIVVGMESNGLDWRPLRRFRQKNELRYLFKPVCGRMAEPVILERMLNAFAIEYANKEYAFSVLPLLFFLSILERLGPCGRWLRKRVHSFCSRLSLKLFGDDKEVCCSAYIELLQAAGYDSVCGLKAHEDDTQVFLNALLTDPQWKRLEVW